MMSILDCLFTSPLKKQAEAEYLAHLRSIWGGNQLSQPSANSLALVDVPPKPRRSPLRVRSIRWRLNATPREIRECEKYIRSLGASGWTYATRTFGLYDCTTVVTWPESKQ